jgi:hypothetical protein
MTFDAAVMVEQRNQRQTRGEIGEHRCAGIQRQGRSAFTQHQQTGDVIDLRVNQHDRGNATVTNRAGGLQFRIRAQLCEQIRRGIDQNPVDTVLAHRNRRLGARQHVASLVTGPVTVHTVAVPLRQSAACT